MTHSNEPDLNPATQGRSNRTRARSRGRSRPTRQCARTTCRAAQTGKRAAEADAGNRRQAVRTALAAAIASAALEPSGPPPCAMSGRPPPPLPPSASTPARTQIDRADLARKVVGHGGSDARLALVDRGRSRPRPSRDAAWPDRAGRANPWGPTLQAPGPENFTPFTSLVGVLGLCGSTAERQSLLRPRPVRVRASCARPSAPWTRASTSSGVVRRIEAVFFSASSRATNHCRALSPVNASMRRTPEDTALSLDDAEHADVTQRPQRGCRRTARPNSACPQRAPC